MRSLIARMRIPLVACILFVLLIPQPTQAVSPNAPTDHSTQWHSGNPLALVDGKTTAVWRVAESRDSDLIFASAARVQWSTSPPVVGASVGFSGDDRVSVEDIPDLAGELTFELWIKPGDISVRRNPLAKAYSGEGNITQEVSGQLTFHHGDGGGNTRGYEFLRSSPLMNDAWSYVVLTRDDQTVS